MAWILPHFPMASARELRKSKIGFVFQKFNLLPTLSARSNIEIAGDIAGLGAPDPRS